MPQRLAGIMSIVAFACCLLVGCFGAENTLSTVIYRALIAMAGTFVVAFVVGWMAEKMINENVASNSQIPANPATSARSGRKIEEISEVK